MNETVTPASRHTAPAKKIPWLTFLYLAAVFFIAQHDWYFSLQGAGDFAVTIQEITALASEGNLPRRVIFFSLGLFAVVSMVRFRIYRIKVNGAFGWLILLFLSWAYLSLAWSVAPNFTLRRLVLLAMLCLGALAVSQRFTLHDTLLWVFFSTLGYLHLGILAEIVLGTFQPLSGGYRFAGTLHPNGQGVNCALLLIAALFLLKCDNRWRKVLVIAVIESLVFLILTKSRTALSLAVFSLFMYWFLSLPLSRRAFVLLCVLFAVCQMLLFGAYLMPALQQAIMLGRENSDTLTLTGRIPIWDQMLGYVAMRPVQGYGYDSFWTPLHIAEIAKEQGWTVFQAHSMYIDCMLSLGIGAGAMLPLIMLAAIRRAFFANRHSQNIASGFIGVILIFAALNGMLESIFIQPTHPTFVCMLALARFGFLNCSDWSEL